MRELPAGWAKAVLAELAEFSPKHDPARLGDMISFVPMPAVSAEFGTIEDAVDRPLSDVWKGFTHFADGDVIFAKITPCMENGKIAVARGLTNGLGCGSTEFHVLRSYGAVLPDFLWRFMRQGTFRKDAEASMTGAVGQRRVPTDYLKAAELPIPPLAEQRRIVAKLDALTARTARARADLDRIPALAARYKQAVLVKAFNGGLTAVAAPWPTKAVGDVLDRVVGGKNLRCEERPPRADELGVVKVSAVSWGAFNPRASKTLPTAFSPPEHTRISRGDFLISRANTLELVGAVVVVDHTPDNLFLSDKVLRLEMPDEWKHWTMWFLRSPEGRAAIEAGSSGNQLSMRNLSQDALRKIEMPWPDRDIQREIVGRIERAFAEIDRLTAEATAARRLLNRLDQAMLAKAFRGELVPQDPADEPAAVLLDRIRAERASAPPAGRRRKAKA